MWKLLEKIFKHEDTIKEVDSQLALELDVYKNLRITYAQKLDLFNKYLLTSEEETTRAQSLANLRALYSTKDPFRHATNLADSQSRLAAQCRRWQKRKLIPRKKTAINEIITVLTNNKLEQLRCVLYIERTLVIRPDFATQLGDFKHALEQEGKLLDYELDTLTQIEERIKTLHEQDDPYHQLSAHTITAFIKQTLYFIGIHDARVDTTGSTARGTGPRTSDYDIILLANQTDYERLKDTTDLPLALNSHSERYFQTLPEIKQVKLEKNFHYFKPQDVQQLCGQITFTDKTSAEIHIHLYKDEARYEDALSFPREHAKWAQETNPERGSRLLRLQQDTKKLKQYLFSAGLYYEKKEFFRTKSVTGVMIEMLLREQRLTKLAQDIAAMGVPWQDNSFQQIRDRLLMSLEARHLDRVLGARTETWDTPIARLQRFAATMQRIIRGKEPGYDLDDFAQLFPQYLCAEIKIKAVRLNVYKFPEGTIKEYDATDLVIFLKTNLPFITAHMIKSPDGKYLMYAAFKGRPAVLHTKKTIEIAHIGNFLKISPTVLAEAAAREKADRAYEYRKNVVELLREISLYLQQ